MPECRVTQVADWPLTLERMSNDMRLLEGESRLQKGSNPSLGPIFMKWLSADTDRYHEWAVT